MAEVFNFDVLAHDGNGLTHPDHFCHAQPGNPIWNSLVIFGYYYVSLFGLPMRICKHCSTINAEKLQCRVRVCQATPLNCLYLKDILYITRQSILLKWMRMISSINRVLK